MPKLVALAAKAGGDTVPSDAVTLRLVANTADSKLLGRLQVCVWGGKLLGRLQAVEGPLPRAGGKCRWERALSRPSHFL